MKYPILNASDFNLSLAKKFFDEQGFVQVRGFISPSQARLAGEWMQNQDPKTIIKSWTDQEPGVPIAVYQYIHKAKNPVGEIAGNPKILEVAGELMGESVYVWSSKVNVKAAWCGTAEYYHQDTVYWKDRGYQQTAMLTCMVCLDPHGIENAGLHVVPGSHKQGFIEHKPFINVNGLQKFMVPPETMNELAKKAGLVVIEAQPGDAVFFHANIVHGSAHNISGRSRMIVLSQLNTSSNKPLAVDENAKKFNLWRAEQEMVEAKRKYEFFKEKYESQLTSDKILFNAPIPEEERK